MLGMHVRLVHATNVSASAAASQNAKSGPLQRTRGKVMSTAMAARMRSSTMETIIDNGDNGRDVRGESARAVHAHAYCVLARATLYLLTNSLLAPIAYIGPDSLLVPIACQ